jgi:4-hydroxyphenylpyruvate dioxygenase-like putative hemolysin
MMRVRRLDHILLAMPAGRESEARKFYQEVLGIPEMMKPLILLREVAAGSRTVN